MAQREETGEGRWDFKDYLKKSMFGPGNIEFYARPDILGLFLNGSMGGLVTTGTGPYTHTFTPADTQAFYTVWRTKGGLVWERADDCIITGLTIKGVPGEELVADAQIMGATWQRLTSAYTPNVSTASVFKYPGSTLTIDTAANSFLTDFEFAMVSDYKLDQTDSINPEVFSPTKREVNVSYTEIFQNIEQFAAVRTGTKAGTTVDSTALPYSTDWQLATALANPKLILTVPKLQMASAALDPTTSPDPYVYVTAGRAEDDLTNPRATVVLINDTVSY